MYHTQNVNGVSDRVMSVREDEASSFVRGVVIDLPDTGEVVVAVNAFPRSQLACDILISSSPIQIGLGDEVLVHCPAKSSERAVVLGRVGRLSRSKEAGEPEKHIAIEASESLTLKCGESSVQLRKDGKVMVLGKDVLTRAKRTARIKGGSVAIN